MRTDVSATAYMHIGVAAATLAGTAPAAASYAALPKAPPGFTLAPGLSVSGGSSYFVYAQPAGAYAHAPANVGGEGVSSAAAAAAIAAAATNAPSISMPQLLPASTSLVAVNGGGGVGPAGYAAGCADGVSISPNLGELAASHVPIVTAETDVIDEPVGVADAPLRSDRLRAIWSLLAGASVNRLR